MAAANINPKILSWARNRAGLTVCDLAKACSSTDEKIIAWESGEEKPTFKKAMNYAKKACIPFGYLFLSEPPEDSLPIPDLRTIDSKQPASISPDLLSVVKIMKQRQAWYKEYLIDLYADKNTAVGRFTLEHSPNEIVGDIRKTLGIENLPSRGTWEEYYRELVIKIENLGIMVMKQSSSQPRRPLNVDEFRGFAIMDDYAPLIFVNHADAPAPRLFTLIHELSHLWIGKSGVSDLRVNNHFEEEALCNAVAAEFLVPKSDFINLWDKELDDWSSQLDDLRKHFHVSTWVLARRALTLNLIDKKQYKKHIREIQKEYEEKKKSRSGGANYYDTKKSEISSLFSKAIINESKGGKLLLRDAGSLLGIKSSGIEKLSKRINL